MSDPGETGESYTVPARRTESTEHRLPAPRGSLRRRVLALLLVVTATPAVVALALSYLATSGYQRHYARSEATTMARTLALELDRQLTQRTTHLTELASNGQFATALRQELEDESPGSRNLDMVPYDRLSDAGLPLLVVDGEHGVRAEIIAGRLRLLEETPSEVAGGFLLDRLRTRPPGRTFAAELPYSEAAGPHLALATPIAGDEGLHLLTWFPMEPVFRATEQINPGFGQRLVIVSDARGMLYSSQPDSDLQALLHDLRLELQEQSGSDALFQARVREMRLGLAAAPVRSMRAMSYVGDLPRIHWSVVHVVDLEESLAFIDRQFWTAVMLALVILGMAVLVARWASRRIVNPILSLTEGMQRFALGDLEYRVRVRTGDELEVLGHAANHMAASLRQSYMDLGNRMLELDEKARLLELISSISHSVNRTLDLEGLFERIIKEIRVQVPCERLSLGLMTEDRTQLRLDYVFPADREDLPRGTMIPLSGSVMGQALREEAVTLVRVDPRNGTWEEKLIAPLGMRVMCIVPLVATNGTVGTLNLSTADPDTFGPREIKILEHISESLSLAVEHGRLFERVARFAQELEETVDRRTRELKAAQAKLVEAEKFAATGSIAAHIAHEVNNPLSIIKNYLRIVFGRLAKPALEESEIQQVRDSLEIVEEEIDRIARIIHQLREASQPSRPTMGIVDIHAEISRIAELFQGTMHKRRIELELNLDPTLRTVEVCGDYLRQIVINLLRNAMDAIAEPAGGIITVRTQKGSPDLGSYLIEVSDTGCGIPAENLSSIFDPFFTTKSEGKGTGLGLAVSQGLARSMGGNIEVTSTVGEGTTMKLILPLAPMLEDHIDLPTGLVGDELTPGGSVIRRQGQRIIIG